MVVKGVAGRSPWKPLGSPLLWDETNHHVQPSYFPLEEQGVPEKGAACAQAGPAGGQVPEEKGLSSMYQGKIQLKKFSRGSHSCQLEFKQRARRLGEGSASKAAYRQAERERSWGMQWRWGERAGEKTDDMASMKHILLIRSKHPPVLCAPTPEGRVAWGMGAALRSGASWRQQDIRSFNCIRKITRHGREKQSGGKSGLL